MKKCIYKIKRFFWLIAVFIVRIVGAKNSYKISRIKALYFNFHGGFTINQVALYDLNKENKDKYLSEFDWYKSRKINYPNGYKLNDKLLCVSLIKDYIKTPETYLVKSHGILKSNDKEIDIDSAINILKKEKSCFFKPTSLGKGNNVFRIDYDDGKFKINFKEVLECNIRDILLNYNNYFISECVKQAKYLDKIYDKTSNTIRVITVRDGEEVKILYAVQRIGVKESIPVDNGSKKGLIAKVDLETGKLSSARCMYDKSTFKKHPDSGNPIEGVVIPNFKDIKKQIIDVTSKLKEFKFIAWDILVTDDGVSVIEANNSSGVNIIQVFDPQRNDVLGDFYRKQKIIK